MKILHLEDNREDAELVSSLIAEEWRDCRINVVDKMPDFMRALEAGGYDVILSDFTMVSFNGLEALKISREKAPEIPFIFISGTIGEERAIEALRSGASDYVLKDRMRRLTTAIKRALKESQERRRRRAAEDARQRFVAILENTPDFVGMCSPDGTVLYINRSGLRMLGLPPDQDVSLVKVAEFHPPEVAEFILGTAIHEAVRDGTWSGETSLLTRGGGRIPVSQVIIAHKDADGNVDYLSTIMRDLTGAKRAEHRIREQAEILNKAREAIVIVGLDNRYSYWNEGAERLFGWRAADVLGRTAEDLFPSSSCEQINALRKATTEAGEWSGELHLATKDGKQVIVEDRTTLVRNDAGLPRARLSIVTDITGRKQMEEHLLRAQRLESIGMLAAGIAHDLNNVLAPILMAAPMLRERATHPTDIKMIEALEKSASRGAGMVRQILGFAHGASGEHRLVQVKHLVRDIANVIGQTFPKDIRLEVSCANDLWPIKANPTQIHQILLNLTLNARDAMHDGGILQISAANHALDAAAAAAIKGARPGSYTVLDVTDTGSGIAPEILTRIWDPFFTTKEAGKGTGLGLSTVRGIVDNHDGFLTIITAVGKGTTFRVFLPAAEADAFRPISDGTNHPMAQITRGDGALILVVDDEPGVRDLTSAILTRHGYRVLTAEDGTEAVTIFSARTADIRLVLTDLNMPNLDGGKLINVLRGLRPDLKVLAFSGMDPTRPGAKAPPASVSGFLAKPFTVEALLGAVEKQLRPPAGPPPGNAAP